MKTGKKTWASILKALSFASYSMENLVKMAFVS